MLSVQYKQKSKELQKHHFKLVDVFCRYRNKYLSCAALLLFYTENKNAVAVAIIKREPTNNRKHLNRVKSVKQFHWIFVYDPFKDDICVGWNSSQFVYVFMYIAWNWHTWKMKNITK